MTVANGQQGSKGTATVATVVLCFCLAIWTAPVGADQLGSGTTSEQPWQGESLGLEDVMSYAFEHAPDLAISRQQLGVSDGLVQEAAGAFDSTLNVSVTLSRQQGALLPPVERQQEGNREILRKVDEEFRAIAERLERQLEENEGPVGVDCGDGNQIIIDGENICETEGDQRERREFAEIVELLIDQELDPERRERLEQIQLDSVADNRASIRGIIDELRLQAEAARGSLERLGGVPPVEIEDSLVLDVGYSMLFRNGQTLTPQLLMEGTNNVFRNKERDPGLGGKGEPLRFRAAAGLTWTVPLGRGGGWESAAAPERAAQLNRLARHHEYRFDASRLGLELTVLYWQLAAAQERLALQQRFYESQNQLLDITRALVQADELPAEDAKQTRANAMDAAGAVLDARSQVRDLRLRLALLMGRDVDALESAPLSARQLPPVPADAEACEVDAQKLVDFAQTRRADHEALEQLRESAEVLMSAAQHDQKPKFDFSLTVAVSSLAEGAPVLSGFSRSLSEDVVGPSVFLSLSGELPRFNHVASGRYRQSIANLNTVQMRLAESYRAIRTAVLARIDGVRSSRQQARLRSRSVTAFERMFAADRERLKDAQATVIDLIVSENRFNSARLAEIDARLAYHVAVALLQHETNRLVAFDQQGQPTGLIEFEQLPCRTDETVAMR